MDEMIGSLGMCDYATRFRPIDHVKPGQNLRSDIEIVSQAGRVHDELVTIRRFFTQQGDEGLVGFQFRLK